MQEQERVQEAIKGNCKTWPKVAIIVLNWNGWRDTVECLESLQRINYPNYQVIVVDNGSTDDSIGKIKAWAQGEVPVESKFFDYDPTVKPVQWIEYDRKTAEVGGVFAGEAEFEQLPLNQILTIIQTGENLGFAGGNNLGIKYALENKAEYVWLLNNDTVVDSMALTELVNVAENNPDAGMVGAKIYYYVEPKRLWHAGGVILSWMGAAVHIGIDELDCGQYDKVREIDYATGCSLLVSGFLIERIGTLDERYFLYWEETDWAVRAKKAGWKVAYTPSSKIWHKVAQSLDDPSSMAYYSTRNRLLFTLKNYPSHLPVALSIGSLRYSLINHILKRRWTHLRMALEGYLDFFLGRWGDYARYR